MAKDPDEKDDKDLRKLVEDAHFRIDELERKLKKYDAIAKLAEDIASVLQRLFGKKEDASAER